MPDLSKLQIAEAFIVTDTSLTASISTTSPAGTESALIVRNIVSGTQSVGGTVTIVPSGTQSVAGTTTVVPSGTQTVDGTVTVVPSGTQTVGGTVTVVPSGTQSVSGTVSVPEVGSTVNHNQKTVTTASAQITTASTSLTFGILVKAMNANTANVYVGASSVSSSNGYELGAGENVSVPIDNANKIYVVSASGTQTVSWVGV